MNLGAIWPNGTYKRQGCQFLQSHGCWVTQRSVRSRTRSKGGLARPPKRYVWEGIGHGISGRIDPLIDDWDQRSAGLRLRKACYTAATGASQARLRNRVHHQSPMNEPAVAPAFLSASRTSESKVGSLIDPPQYPQWVLSLYHPTRRLIEIDSSVVPNSLPT